MRTPRHSSRSAAGLGLFCALLVMIAACGGAGTGAVSSQAPKLNESTNALVAAARGEIELTLSWAPGFLDYPQEMRRHIDGFNKLYGLNLRINFKPGPSMPESSARAIREYQDAIAKGRDSADVRTDLGNAFRFSGQSEKALEQYTIAQRQNPQHENSLFNQIGLFMEVMHDPIRAIPICEEFLRRFPNSEKVPRVREQLQIAKDL